MAHCLFKFKWTFVYFITAVCVCAFFCMIFGQSAIDGTAQFIIVDSFAWYTADNNAVSPFVWFTLPLA